MKRHDTIPRGRPAGMTLIELLVSLGVLALIGIAVGMILGETKKVVDKSNALMRANAAASAIARVIRDDLARLSTEGFLAVYNPQTAGPADPNNCLVFTAVGPFTSQTAPGIVSNAARVDYGLQGHSAGHLDDAVLRRRAILLTGTGAGGSDPDLNDDVDPTAYLGLYTIYSGSIGLWIPAFCIAPTVPTEPVSPAIAGQMWPMLAKGCGTFRVEWWDTSAGTWSAANNIWTAATPNVPPVIKVNFSLQTGATANESIDYEVICPIRR